MSMQQLTLNGAMLGRITAAVESGALTSGVLGLDKRDWTFGQVCVQVKDNADGSHVLLRVAVIAVRSLGIPVDRAAVYMEVERATGDWVFSEAAAFDAGETYREHERQLHAARRAARVS